MQLAVKSQNHLILTQVFETEEFEHLFNLKVYCTIFHLPAESQNFTPLLVKWLLTRSAHQN